MNNKPINSQNQKYPHDFYVPWLGGCFALFVFRVLAQLIQKFYNLPFLPSFEAWYSGTLAYPWLFASQIIIIAIMSWTMSGFIRKNTIPRRTLGIWLFAMGGIYFASMSFRLIAVFTFATGHPWLGAHIPAFFHIVLASFVLLLGHFHYRHSKGKSNNEP